jgi:putative ABC transport system permease protein
MFTYHLRLAFKSLKRNPVIAGLMTGAIALGVGICITTLTVYRLMSGNPIEHRNDALYAVTLDGWSADRPNDDDRPELPPSELTYRDAMALLGSEIPKRKIAMHKSGFVLDPVHTEGAKPFLVEARMTTKDFFPMFDVPFLYGSGWDQSADNRAQMVIVLSKETNEKAFGGANSVGRSLQLDGREFKVIGVLDDWLPTPKFYDLNNGAFDKPEEIFVPLRLTEELQLSSHGNINCWKEQPIDSFRGFLESECVWMQFWVELSNSEQVASFQSFIDNYVREQKTLGRFERPLNNRLTRPDEWLTVNEVVRDDNRVLVGLSFMFLAVCLLNMIGLLLAKFLGAAPMVGLRRALGASRGAIFHQHLVEVGVIGLGGGVFGILVAGLGLLGVRQLYNDYDALTHLDVTMALIALVIAVFSGVIAGLYPTWRICSVQPARHLKTQ